MIFNLVTVGTCWFHSMIFIHTRTHIYMNCSVTKSCPTLWPHGLQHSRFPCLSLSPGVCSNSHPLRCWCHSTISFSVAPFTCPQSFPASGSFPISCLFVSGSQSIGTSASVLPMNIQGWFLLDWLVWCSCGPYVSVHISYMYLFRDNLPIYSANLSWIACLPHQRKDPWWKTCF